MALPMEPNQPLSDAQARQRNNRDAAGRWTETERTEPESVQLEPEEKELPPIDERLVTPAPEEKELPPIDEWVGLMEPESESESDGFAGSVFAPPEDGMSWEEQYDRAAEAGALMSVGKGRPEIHDELTYPEKDRIDLEVAAGYSREAAEGMVWMDRYRTELNESLQDSKRFIEDQEVRAQLAPLVAGGKVAGAGATALTPGSLPTRIGAKILGAIAGILSAVGSRKKWVNTNVGHYAILMENFGALPHSDPLFSTRVARKSSGAGKARLALIEKAVKEIDEKNPDRIKEFVPGESPRRRLWKR